MFPSLPISRVPLPSVPLPTLVSASPFFRLGLSDLSNDDDDDRVSNEGIDEESRTGREVRGKWPARQYQVRHTLLNGDDDADD